MESVNIFHEKISCNFIYESDKAENMGGELVYSDKFPVGRLVVNWAEEDIYLVFKQPLREDELYSIVRIMREAKKLKFNLIT